ncbi:MAG: hypothetical protein K2I89_01340, partial [Muribaculaceae bacterium]|nr:hypothetical protein [Muribaculaceae bacterium]
MTINIKCIVIGAAFAASIFCSNAAESDSVSTAKKELSGYIPKIHGVMRTRFEQLTSDSKEGRFQIANARLNISGNVTDFASYFFQVDFCDKGVIKILDAFTTL